MVNLTINGKAISVAEHTTILEAAKANGINIPTLCYLKEINEVGACRICLVDIEGVDKLMASCNTECEEGMVVRTDTKRVREARKMNLELILSQHKTDCLSCVRDGNCKLQEVSKELNMTKKVPQIDPRPNRWKPNQILERDNSKCIQCFRCVNVCEKVQCLNVWDLLGTGKNSKVGINPSKKNFLEICSLCGQCITHCPTGALYVRDDTQKFYDAVLDPEVVTVVQVAPAVRSAYGEAAGLPKEIATEGRMAAAIKALGVDYVFDTNFSADLTIMEEGTELLKYLGERETDLPMFTSCCPGWVRFAKIKYPEIVGQLSSAKSPQQMFGAVTKSYFAEKIGVSPEKICCISIMPCTAKKYESGVPEVQDAAELVEGANFNDVDMVLTTRELTRLLRPIDIAELEEIPFDSPLGAGTGAAVIFGRTGGVMEAALRTAAYVVEGQNPDPKTFNKYRNKEGNWAEAAYDIGGTTVRTAVVSGLANADKLMKAIVKGKVKYDFVEVMACPGGCAGGGGQPIKDGEELADSRAEILDMLDENNEIRYSHENPEVKKLYEDYLEAPLSHASHHLLHTDQEEWTL